MTFLIGIFIILSTITARAEYRVFTLKITNTKTQVSHTIKSTLDPEQYKSYFPLQYDEQISYVKTWRCQGSTRDFTALCEAPLSLTPSPASTTPQQNVQNKS